MSLRMVSLLASRLGSLVPSVTSGSFRQASRDANKWSYAHRVTDHRPTRRRNEVFEDKSDIEHVDDVEEKLQALVSEERRMQRTVKYHQIRRQMTPKGAPERKLSWDAMAQIRYLKQEEPEEWTVERLAEGFSVSPDVIRRVLRSKFVPTPERKAKQDTNVLAKHRQQSLPAGAKPGQDRPQLPRHVMPAMLPAGGATGALVTLASQSLVPREDGTRALVNAGVSLVPLAAQNRVSLPFSSKRASLTELSGAEEDATVDNVFEVEDEEEEECWDGYVFTEEQLEELVNSTKPSPVTQIGNEFFDSDGIFLYRL